MINVEIRTPDVTIFKQHMTDELAGFSDIHDIPRDKAGIILFYDNDDQVMFVAKARKLRFRTKKHLEDQFSPLKDVRDEIAKISVWYVDSAMEREMLETYFINTERATYNREKVFFE